MSAEKVLGGFEVETRLSLGSEHLFLLLTQTRLIMAHFVKVGKRSMSLSNLLGGMARGVGRAPKKPEALEKMAALAPESILALDKDNFAVGYDQVVTMTVEPGEFDRADITLVTSNMKVVMSASLTAVNGVREMMESCLNGKVTFRL